ncbi:hypothetical protein EXIGLDRAFT_725892 [Exidia glandulosa HHB12029]|uniref:Uncharacterized protein n=1 Tax=Exidia glandulosa HHB12029 TaxID=1314781 RepID=A0A165MHC7_EXIGL|nr:hypothetical protein EXIGLDRAFT_725892 [Exidia glandulosa HHB12029]
MPNYLWIGLYESRPERHASCLVVTYETDSDAFGNLYTLSGLPPHCSAEELRSVQLVDAETDSPLFVSRVLLGIIPDNVMTILPEYVREAVVIVNDGVLDEDWIVLIVRSFEDSRFLPEGSLTRAQEALNPPQ